MTQRATPQSPALPTPSSVASLSSFAPNDISTGLLAQLETNRQSMYQLSTDFSPALQVFIKTAVDVALVCHYAHTRIGSPPIHYSHHLFEVMRRVRDISATNPSDPKQLDRSLAVKLAVAALHDSMEDIVRTFPTLTDRVQGFSVVEDYIRLQLTPIIDPATIDTICESVQTLSIKNDSDFNDSQYIAGIIQSEICLPIKWADVDHNMITMPDAGVTTGAVTYPAQYNALMKASPYYDAFVHQVLVCAKRCETRLSRDKIEESKLGRALKKLYTFEGEAGLFRLQEFYDELHERLQQEPESPVFPKRYNTDRWAAVINSHRTAIEDARSALT